MILEELVEKPCHMTTQETALRHGAGLLLGRGLVAESYVGEVIKREGTYPTGIESHVNFSICHTDTSHSIGDGMCMLVLESPIKFHSMADASKTLDVSVIFMLASTTASGHMRLLQDIVGIMSDSGSANRILAADSEELLELLHDNIRRDQS